MRWFVLFVFFSFTSSLVAQGTKADYERMAKLGEVRRNTLANEVTNPVWRDDGKMLEYTTTRPDGKQERIRVRTADGSREVVPVEKTKDAPKAAPEPANPRRRGQAGKAASNYRVSIDNHNVVLRDNKTDKAEVLTTDGTEANPYTSRHWFSPDGKKLVVQRRTPGAERRVTLVESSPKDQLQPKTSTYFYLKPGDEVPKPQPVLFDLDTKKMIPIKNDLFADPYDIGFEEWSVDGRYFLFFYNQRGHEVVRVIRIDSTTGETKAIINEEPKTFVDYSQKLTLRYLKPSNEIIWASERSGFNHLYLVNIITGETKPITQGISGGNWLVRAVEAQDDEKRELRLRIMGYHADQSPYHEHFARVNYDGTGFTVLTEGDGTHRLNISPDGRYAVDTFSRVDLPPISELRDLKENRCITTLEKADISKLTKTGRVMPERFVALGRDGSTPIHGVIFRPTTFEKGKKYKVIEYIYAGPHGYHVPIAFSTMHRSAELMAELGFIVVSMDGMGTNWRSKSFHDVCWKNLGDSGFADRIPWIKAAAAKYPEMDIAGGVGIFGGSAGGQSSTRALLAHGDFYKVAVSDCGCHDNRMDKIWWNEAWMGKVGPHYAEQSNVTQAHKLTGKLMLVVGELDKNVDPASTYQVANALIKANKDFDLLIMPGVGHGSAEQPYASRRRADFFVRNLAGVEPRR